MSDTLSPHELFNRCIFVLFKHKWLASATFVLTIVITFFVAYLFASHKATTRILVRHSSQQQLILFQDLETPRPVNPLIIPAYNLVQFSTSQGMAETVAREFGLDQPRKLKNPRDHIKHWIRTVRGIPKGLLVKAGLLAPENMLDTAIDKLINHMEDIQVHRETEIVDLGIWYDDPEVACGIANYMADLLVEKTEDITQSQAARAYEFAKEQVAVAEKSLHEAEDVLSAFKLEMNIVSLQDERHLLLAQLGQLRQARTVTMADLREAEAKVEEIGRQLGEQEPLLVSASVMGVNPTAQELNGMQHTLAGQLASLRVANAAMHPQIAELQARIAELQERLAEEPEMIPQSETTVPNPVRQSLLVQMPNLEADVAALQAKIETWSQELQAVEEAATALSKNELILQRLQREQQTHEERFTTLKTKLLELEVQRLTESSAFDIRVIDRAHALPNAGSDFPPMKWVLYGTPVLALFFALCLPFLFEYMDDALDMPRDVEKVLALPVLGTIPADGRRRKAARNRKSNEGGGPRD